MQYLASLVSDKLDIKIASDFDKAILAIVTIILCVMVIMVVLYLAKMLIFKLYCKCTNETIQNTVTKVIYSLDELADNMSNSAKRKDAINSVKDIFIWRSIPIPNFIIGIIIDLEVKAIRKLQADAAKYKNPYLHEDDESCEDNGEIK